MGPGFSHVQSVVWNYAILLFDWTSWTSLSPLLAFSTPIIDLLHSCCISIVVLWVQSGDLGRPCNTDTSILKLSLPVFLKDTKGGIGVCLVLVICSSMSIFHCGIRNEPSDAAIVLANNWSNIQSTECWALHCSRKPVEETCIFQIFNANLMSFECAYLWYSLVSRLFVMKSNNCPRGSLKLGHDC